MLSKDFYQNVYSMEKKLPKSKFLEVYSWMVSNRTLWEESTSHERLFSDLSQGELLQLEEAMVEDFSEKVFEEEEE